MDVCPICGRNSMGKIGAGHYYCSECCLEFMKKHGSITAYHVETDGTLSQYFSPAETICISDVKEG